MKLSLFNYHLPKSLIANKPASPRDHCRLMIYNKQTKQIQSDYFYNLTQYLTKGDILVFNDSKVFPARLLGQKETGGRAELLLLHLQPDTQNWEVLIGAKHPKIGLKLRFNHSLEATLVSKNPGKTWLVKFNFNGRQFQTILNKIGQVPLPPYIASTQNQTVLKKQYQTIYARETGSAAAPTAGLHFTKPLLARLKKKGISFEYITLHVGLGTFDPVNTDNIEDYQIHSEYFSLKNKTWLHLLKAKQQGKRIIAVGTTSARTLESLAAKLSTDKSPTLTADKLHSGSTNIFIYPGYKFKFIDALITNFHLPKSSLLMLVSAFIGRPTTLKLYRLAIKHKYKFFSFGDALFLT